jgi:hypothetical protein
MKENAQTEEVHLRHFLNLRQDRDRLPLKDVMDMEISSEMHVSTVNKQERELEGLGLGDANGEEQILEANGVEKLICTPCDGKERHSLPKVHNLVLNYFIFLAPKFEIKVLLISPAFKSVGSYFSRRLVHFSDTVSFHFLASIPCNCYHALFWSLILPHY